MSLFNPILLFLLVTVFTYWCVEFFRRWALQHKMVYEPGELTAHTQTTPHGGGLIIVLVALVGFAGTIFAEYKLPLLPLIAYLNGAVLVAAISWFDDVSYLSIGVRFTGHSLAALMMVGALVIAMTQSGSMIWVGQWGWLAGIAVYLWLAGFANLFNFMDGIDGMVGLQSVIAGSAWSLIGWYVELPCIMALGLFIAAANFGFLGHNWAPAQIFMGDVSSVFLGYTLAALPLLAAQADLALLPLGIIFTWPCLFDPVQTLVRRLWRGESIFVRHRSFLFHRLVIAGYQHSTVSLAYGTLSFIASVLAVTWYMNFIIAGLILTIGIMAFALWRTVDALDAHGLSRHRTPEARMIDLADASGHQSSI